MIKQLFLLAHQDDEILIYPVLRAVQQAGEEVRFVFMTRGLGEMEVVRTAESRKVLKGWGFSDSDIFSVGEALNIFDGQLPQSLRAALEFLKEKYSNQLEQGLKIWTPDWEGGHHDHDSTFAIGALLAKQYPCVKHHSFPLYRSWCGFSPLFKVGSLIDPGQGAFEVPITLRDKFIMLKSISDYPSQWKTWLVLGPFLFFFIFFKTRLRFRSAEKRVFPARPHPGRLFYEERFKVPYEAVEKAAKLETL